MTTVAIKEKLIKQIQNTNNSDILQEVYRLLEIESTDLDILILSEFQKKKIKLSMEDLKNGRIISNEDAENEISKWLRK